jgi:hypothetical protein
VEDGDASVTNTAITIFFIVRLLAPNSSHHSAGSGMR